MGLLSNEKNTSAVFEAEEDYETPAQQAPVQAAPAATVPAVRPSSAVSAFHAVVDTVGALKNAMPVTFDMLISLVATNGNICRRENKKSVGDTLTFELLSWQDSFVIAPGDDKAPKETVKYSNDGITCSDGTPVQEHLRALREMMYTKAKVTQRAILVGSVIKASKDDTLADELVQIDLSPQSRTAFNNYAVTAMNKQRLGKVSAEQVTQMRATAVLATMNGNTFTKLEFSGL